MDAATLAAVAAFLRGTHLLAPHDVPAHVAHYGRLLGFEDAVVHLVDLQQRVLVPFQAPLGASPTHHVSQLSVDATLPGRVFQYLAPAGHDHVDGRTRVWTPLLNGTERLGVLAVTVAGHEALDAGHPVGQRLRLFATLTAEVVMTKTLYSDTLVRLRRTADMGLAAEVQWNLLPPLTFASKDVSIAAALEPAYEVAGDSVDYAIDVGIARFAVFDGMGHELRSSQLVGLAVAAYRNARRHGHNLSDTATEIDQRVSDVFGGDGFTTALLAELDTTTGQLTWLNAGHPPPLLLRRGHLVKTLELQPVLPFGLALDHYGGPRSPSRTGFEQLEPGDHVLLYTDGVTEARSPEGEMFGIPRLVDLITRNLAAGLPAAETMRRAVRALLAHQGSDLSDDATMLLAQWRPDHPEDLHI